MKTMKQVLAEFQRMQNQLCGKVSGFVDVKVYNSSDMWEVEITVTEFDNGEITRRSNVAWGNYRDAHDVETEAENKMSLAQFKKKFNIK